MVIRKLPRSCSALFCRSCHRASPVTGRHWNGRFVREYCLYLGLVHLVNLNLLRLPRMLVSLYLVRYRDFLHIWFVLTKSPQPGSHPKGRTSEVVVIGGREGYKVRRQILRNQLNLSSCHHLPHRQQHSFSFKSLGALWQRDAAGIVT